MACPNVVSRARWREHNNFPVTTEILNDCVSSHHKIVDNPEMMVPTLNGDFADPEAHDESSLNPRN
jgi:hypothetical protein